MSGKTPMIDQVRMILILALVALGSLLFTDIIAAPIITILAYFVLTYRRKIRRLESRLTESAMRPPSPDRPEPPATPSSTEA